MIPQAPSVPRKWARLFFLLLFAELSYGCQTKCKMNGDETERLITRIESCQPWTSIYLKSEPDGLNELNQIGGDFERLSIDDARHVVEVINSNSMAKAEKGEPLASQSKVYVLLRFYFKVPTNEKTTATKYFGGWWGVPEKDSEVNLLWPLSEEGGVLRITNDFTGYSGEPYDAIGEFDFFNERYGRRK